MVTEPTMNVRVVAPAAMAAVAVVQTTMSPVAKMPVVSLQEAVAVPVSVLALVASTAPKYMNGKLNTMVPPMGTGFIVVKPSVTVPVLTVPGTLSVPVVNAMSTPVVSWLPRARVALAEANCMSTDVATLKVAAA